MNSEDARWLQRISREVSNRPSHDHVEVFIPDEFLVGALGAALKNKPGAPLIRLDLQRLKSLDGGDFGITNLEGIEACENLSEVYLWGNMIRDISPLLDLPKLSHVQLFFNPLSQESFATHIPKLILKGVGIEL